VGRVAVVSQTGVKWYQVRPGLNSVLAPGFNDTYHLVFDTGYSRHIYRVEIPMATQLQVAEAQARSLLRELKYMDSGRLLTFLHLLFYPLLASSLPLLLLLLLGSAFSRGVAWLLRVPLPG
jgi:hypothetical protein